LSFLLAVHTDYAEEKFFSALFSEFSFNEKYFDKFWNIVEIDIFEKSEGRTKECSVVRQAAEQCDNERVKEWLFSLCSP